ncbi:MAG: hypothetical protein QOH76_3566 [Thermoleophilaceae bacterium]|nr:hypothetical protein [Thermoleophilaceae bacterium]
MRSARAAWLVALAVVASGCGKDEDGKKDSTSASKPATSSPKPATTPAARPHKPAKRPSRSSDLNPNYRPSGYHRHRARGVIYNNEGISEDVLTAPYDRIIELFGQPAHRRGKCIRYRIVGGEPHQSWEFCFKGQEMTAASVEPGYQ